MKSTRSIQLFAGAITAVLSLQSVQAATGTWSGPTVTGNWDTTETNWTGVAAGAPWAAQGNNAVFDTANNVATVNTSIFVDNWSIASSGNRLTIDAGQTVTAGKLSNGNLLIFGTGHTSNADGNLLTINGTLNFGPTTNTSDVFRLGSDNGSNASSYNGIVINSGGMLKHVVAGGGTHNDQVGPIAGADYNYVDINGGTFDRQGNQRFTVGVSGNYNTMTIRNGGTFTGTQSMATWGGTGNRVLHIGDQGSGAVGTGSFNSVTINGPSSIARIAQQLTVGGIANNSSNYLKVENGGTLYVAFSGNTSLVGGGAASNNNYIQATGTGSALNISNSANGTRFLTIGNNATADNNHLDVLSGATADLRTGVILGANSATNSKFNLGDGNGISTASVGFAGVTAISLASASSLLNINSGRLTANATGSLVSGAGKVELNGPANAVH